MEACSPYLVRQLELLQPALATDDIIDAVGPESFTFNGLVEAVGTAIGLWILEMLAGTVGFAEAAIELDIICANPVAVMMPMMPP